MNLVKANDVISTQALWIELTDLDGELVYGGKGKGKGPGKPKGSDGGNKTAIDIYAYDSNVLVAGRDNELGDNAF
jgi:hypothetical protein